MIEIAYSLCPYVKMNRLGEDRKCIYFRRFSPKKNSGSGTICPPHVQATYFTQQARKRAICVTQIVSSRMLSGEIISLVVDCAGNFFVAPHSRRQFT